MTSIQASMKLVIFIILISQETSGVIKKCCNLGQRFHYKSSNKLECGPNNSTKQQFQFPKHLDGSPMIFDNELAQHKLVFGEPQCSSKSKDILYLYKKNNVSDFTFKLEGGEIMLKSLKLDSLHYEDGEHAQLFPPSTYCVDSVTGEDYIAILCPCEVIQCVRKCCRNFHGISETTGACTKHTANDWYEWIPEIKEEQEEEVQYYRLVNKYPDCGERVPAYWKVENTRIDLNGSNPNTLFLLKNGSLQTENKAMLFPVDEYCTEYSANLNKTTVIYCYHEDLVQANLLLMTSMLYLINAIALWITVVLMLVITEMRASLHNKMALAHNIMLTIGFTTTGAAQWLANSLESETCVAISYIILYSLLASSFWLNSMCIDITIVFSKGFRQVQPKLQNENRFTYYSLYAWGATSAIILAIIVIDFASIIPSLHPRFGESKCFFSNDTAQLVFLYVPWGILFSANLVMFVYTLTRIVLVRRDTTILNSANSYKSEAANMQTLKVFVKLFGLMGISWISEVISWSLKSFGPFWIPVDILNLSRGIFIFVIFCCTPTVMRNLRSMTYQLKKSDSTETKTTENSILK